MKAVLPTTALVLISAALSGCRSDVFRHPDFHPQLLRGKRVALVADARVHRRDGGDRWYACVSDSRRAARRLATALSAYLASHGLPAANVELLSVGHAVGGGYGSPGGVSRWPGEVPRTGRRAVWMNEPWQQWPPAEAEAAQAHLIDAVRMDFAFHRHAAAQLAGNAAFQQAIGKLREQYGCDYVLVAASWGQVARPDQVYEDYTVEMGYCRDRFYAGSRATFRPLPTGLRTEVALVDARTGQLLWANLRDDNDEDGTYLPRRLFGGEGRHLRYEDVDPRPGRVVRRVLAGLDDPALEVWCRRPWNGPWLRWADRLLKPMVRIEPPEKPESREE